MYTVTWLEIECPTSKCGKVNWVRLGNVEDLTVADPTHFTCWGCKQEILLSDEFENENDEDDKNVVDGLQKP